MQILQVNSFYPFTKTRGKYHYPYGGQEAVMLFEKQLLEAHGHKLIAFAMQHPEKIVCEHSDYFMPYVDLTNTNGIMNKIKTSGRLLYSFEARKRLSQLLDSYPVDVAHLHSISHHISPSILHELRKRKIPIVITLHHFKMVCANYYMLVNGKPCEACRGGRYFMAIKNSCVRASLAKSILCTLEMYLHLKILDIYRNVNIFISPSQFLKNKCKEMGFEKEIVYLPNFVNAQRFDEFNEEVKGKKGEKENSIVYFGRLSLEKGLDTLLDSAKLLSRENNVKEMMIKIIGEGPTSEELRERVESEKINNVRFLGYMEGEHLYREIKKSMAVVLPSEWYENNPIAVLEAFALQIPVIGARIGGIPELVRDNETGLTFEPGNVNDMVLKMKYVLNNPDEVMRMGENARVFIEKELSKEKHYEKLIEIYGNAMSKKHIGI